MNTFLPYPSYIKSAQCLDNKRLGKQRVEVLQIYNALQPNSTSKWRNHPAVKMWRGHEEALLNYGIATCDEWIKRGFKDTVRLKLMSRMTLYPTNHIPVWLGNEAFHASHRSNLLRKDKEWYGKFGWTEPDNLPYIWNSNS